MGERDIIVGVTGASGVIYAQALVRELLSQKLTIHFIPTAHAAKVWRDELREKSDGIASETQDWFDAVGVAKSDSKRFVVYDDSNIEAAPASGTFRARAMIVVPCSMNTLAKIAHGIADTLLTRTAGVSLKERRPLILVPRETPLSLIDLRNMVAVVEAGGVVLPAMPGFYQRPATINDLIEFVVSKICDRIGLQSSHAVRYQGGM